MQNIAELYKKKQKKTNEKLRGELEQFWLDNPYLTAPVTKVNSADSNLGPLQ